MHPYPHRYEVCARTSPSANVQLDSPDLPALESAAPREFDGPGDRWSPETLLVAAVADCFVLSFKAVASASKFDWLRLECAVAGRLDRVERVAQFTQFDLTARLVIPAGADRGRAQQLLEKSKQICLVSNSLKAPCHLQTEITGG